MEFKPFPKIERLGNIGMFITQKIHGTNAQIYIVENNFSNSEYADLVDYLPLTIIQDSNNIVKIDDKSYTFYCGSRTRWITPEDDNFGFAKHVYENKEEFVKKLGVGQHFGEWAGPGINSGEGLTEKTFVLFNHFKFPPERPLPPKTVVVPLLYSGKFDLTVIDTVMEDLKTSGSKLAPGFMRPEGIVVSCLGERFKKVFDAEETNWKKGDKPKLVIPDDLDVDHLMQPVRLEKLLSRDEKYLKEYPKSIGLIIGDYIQDLIVENQIPEKQDIYLKLLKKRIFPMIKEICEKAKDSTPG